MRVERGHKNKRFCCFQQLLCLIYHLFSNDILVIVGIHFALHPLGFCFMWVKKKAWSRSCASRRDFLKTLYPISIMDF
jgi:hypothetical protein